MLWRKFLVLKRKKHGNPKKIGNQFCTTNFFNALLSRIYITPELRLEKYLYC